MKTLALILSTASLLASAASMACMSPPPGTPAITVQTRNLENEIGDEVVQEAIKAQGLKVRIRNINMESGVQILLTNGCQFKISRDYSGASPGTCPELLPVKLIEMDGCGEQE